MKKTNDTPQLENGYVKIANELYEALMQINLSGYERRVLDAIIRKTYGFNKKSDYIALSQISELTKINKSHISRSIKQLQKYNIVTKIGNSLSVNKAYKAWKVTKIGKGGKLPKMVTGVTKIGKKKLPKQALQKTYKDNITKDILLRNTKSYGNSDINSVKEYFLIRMSLPKEDCSIKQSRQYWYLLLKESKTGADGVKWLIDLASKDEFYKNNITSSKDLYYKRIKIIARKRGNKPKFAVMEGGVKDVENNNRDKSLLADK